MAVLGDDIEVNARRVQKLMFQSALTESRRDELTVLLTAVQTQISERRAKLDAEGQRQFDTQAQIAAANLKLQGLTEEQARLLALPAETVELEHVPTALSKSIDGHVIHVRLAHGNLAVVPVDQLMEQYMLRSHDYLSNEMSRRDHSGGIFGPIDGFVMRYYLEKDDGSKAAPPGGPRLAPRPVTLHEKAAFRAAFDRIGEPIDQALMPESQFMRTLTAKGTPCQALVVNVYPNSYDALRTLKQAMWERGISIAVAPRRYGEDIVHSTGGHRLRAQ
jgi:hypothetical protein